jgi:Tfp pilus assembly protein PilN
MKSTIPFLLLATLLASCTFHFYTKKELLKKHQQPEENQTFIDSNNFVRITNIGKTGQRVDDIFEFDNTGKQLKSTLITTCTTCFNKYLTNMLSYKQYGWLQLNDTVFISKYALKTYLYTHPSQFTYQMSRHNLPRKAYKKLVAHATKPVIPAVNN